MRNAVFGLLSAVALSSVCVSGAQSQPPPPPPPGMPEYVKLLDGAYSNRDLEAYGSLFKDDVKVYSDGELVASNRIEFLQRIKGEFDNNLFVTTISWAQGGQLLLMQRITGCIPKVPSPNAVYHGCLSARSLRYDLASDYKIANVHILGADKAWNMHGRPE